MSAPRCAVCHDSGSKNQTGDYLDCPACDMPHTRKALNDFVKSLGTTHPEDVALAIHQQALAIGLANSVEGVLTEMQPGGALHMPQEPVAHLKYWAAQRWSGCGDHEIEYGEGLEVCEPGEIGADGQPAFPVFLHAIPGALAMAPKQEAPHSMAFIGLANSDQFKYVLEQLATGQPNPKERRRLVREVRDAIKLCAASQVKDFAETLSVRNWIKVEDRLPEPYEEVRILFDGVPRIARLNHARAYFQLASFIDCKGQYIASLDNVHGWMPLALAPGKESHVAAPAAANGALPELPEPARYSPNGREPENFTVDQMRAYGQACAAAGPDAAQELIASLISLWDSKHLLADDYIEQMSAIEQKMRALSGAKGN